MVALALLLALVAAACGGGDSTNTFAGGGDDTAGDDGATTGADTSADDGTATDGGDGGTTADGTTTDGSTADGSVTPPGDCPALGETLDRVNAATYAVYGEVFVQTDAGPELVHFQIGTAWGIDRRLLVTNAHVTQAFVDFAAQGVQLSRALAIQAGTGEVVELLRQLTHPDYNGDPLRSPDVGLFTTRDEVTNVLTLADDTVPIELGQEVQIVGFPGDVTEFIEVVPGETIPQATSLNGQVTALRVHDDTMEVTPDNVDVIQHQAPTTPGTSGSSMVACGEVIGVNNAGTVNLIATPAEDGSLTIDRQAAAANNFAVHVRHIRELIELFEDNAIQGAELPAPAVVQPMTSDPMGGGGGDGGGDGGGEQPSSGALVLSGEVGDPYVHVFTIEVDEAGIITGTSDWNGNVFNLNGQFFEDGTLAFVDDAFEQSGGELRRGVYVGEIVDDTTIGGIYSEEGDEATQAQFVAVLQ